MEKDKKYFEDKFKDFESVPPLGAWNNIESGLNEKASRKKVVFIMRIAAGLLLLITAIWLTWPNLNTQEKSLAENEKVNKIEKTEKQNTPDNNQIAAIDSENQKKLIKPQQNENYEEKEVEKEPKIQNVKTNTDVPITDSKKVQKIKKAEEKHLESKDDIKKEIEKIDIIDTKPLLAETEIDTSHLIESPMETELIANNEVTNHNEQLKDENDSKSITIILRPKAKNQEGALASNDLEEEEQSRFKKFKETFYNDLYKQKIRLGEVPDLALNKLKLRSN